MKTQSVLRLKFYNNVCHCAMLNNSKRLGISFLACVCTHTQSLIICTHTYYVNIIIFTTAYAEDCPDFELLVQIHCGVPAERDCILKRWVCDGYPDCPQENDESPATCQNSEFLLGL